MTEPIPSHSTPNQSANQPKQAQGGMRRSPKPKVAELAINRTCTRLVHFGVSGCGSVRLRAWDAYDVQSRGSVRGAASETSTENRG